MSKALELALLLPKSPAEFCDRLLTIFEFQGEKIWLKKGNYEAISPRDAFERLASCVKISLESYLNEQTLVAIESTLKDRQSHMPVDAPFRTFHNGGSLLGRGCYAVARALQPEVIVETGVCYGVTSSYLLKGLETNGKGVLHSIDLPPLGRNGDCFVGWLVPSELKSRWRLHRGTSKRLLRPLLNDVGPVDIFIHDSLHTYRNMSEEFDAAWTALRPGGVLLSDDIGGNAAFLELSTRPNVALVVVMKEPHKNALLGVAVKGHP